LVTTQCRSPWASQFALEEFGNGGVENNIEVGRDHPLHGTNTYR
jgi:hypothetical protein